MRLDIQLLRVIAVVSVVLGHFFPGYLPGGFVGVDIFFVISGYLMGSILIREGLETGRVAVVRFWLLRATRLFPQAFFVIATVSLVMYGALPLRDGLIHMPDAIAAAFFGENLLLAWESSDYFAANQETSALQHYWSLSVEEQFYIFLPIVLAGIFVLKKFSIRSSLVVFGLMVLASVIYSQWLVMIDPVVGYFHTFARIWELGLGVMVALLSRDKDPRGRHLLGYLGLVALGVSILFFGPNTPFPGVWALLPTLGTALVIYAGPLSFLTRLGGFRPLSWVADHSYGIYLWHWPSLILFEQIYGERPTPLQKISLIILSFVLAWLSTRFIEAPIRYRGRELIRSGNRLRTIALTAALSMGLVASGPALAYNAAVAEQSRLLAEAQERFAQSQTSTASGELAECVGPQEMDPEIACKRSDDGFDFYPSLDAADADDDNRKECWSTSNSQRFNVCEIGETENFTKTVFAVGDSHAAAYLGAFDLLGKEQGWKIYFAGKGGCFWTAAPLKKPENLNTQYCLEWRDKIQQYLDESPPFDFIIATNSARTARGVLTEPGETFEKPATQGLVDAWLTQTTKGVPIFAIKDSPFPMEDHLDCIESAVYDPRVECHIEVSDSFEAFDPIVAASEIVEGAHLIDLSHLYCDQEYCPPIIGGVLVHRDDSHITGTWAKMLVPYIIEQIDQYQVFD